MNVIKILSAILIPAAIFSILPGCTGQATGQTDTGSQTAKVIRGNLILDISAAGNLALSHSEDLAVELFYPAGTKGTIGEVLVEEGETVVKGQVLATIDKDEWEEHLAELEAQVTAKERALIQAQINLKNAEQALKSANQMITTRESSVLSAEIALTQAQNTLAGAITSIDFVPIAAALNRAKAWYEYVTVIMPQSGAAARAKDYDLILQNAKEQLDAAQTAYDNALSGFTSEDVNLKKKQVQVAENNLAAAKEAVIDARNDVILKELSLTLSQGNLEDAEKALEDARKNLAEAQQKSPEITAPFDGFITQINVKGGDEVLNGTVVARIADPDKFEAEILVSEMDILDVKVGSKATVTADALPGVIMTATVTRIAPTATISAGVVNYKVRVEVEPVSANPFVQSGNTGGTQFPSNNGTLPGNFNPGEELQQGGGFSSSDAAKFFSSGNLSGLSKGQTFNWPSINNAANVELKEGMTVTVTILVTSRTGVLLVPNGAIITEGTQSYVEVINGQGALEKRAVTVGISNWQYTEITEGLTEGEEVKVNLNLAPDTNFQRGGGAFFMRGG